MNNEVTRAPREVFVTLVFNGMLLTVTFNGKNEIRKCFSAVVNVIHGNPKHLNLTLQHDVLWERETLSFPKRHAHTHV